MTHASRAPLFALLFLLGGCTSFGDSIADLMGSSDIIDRQAEEFAVIDVGDVNSPESAARHLVVNIGDRIFFSNNSEKLSDVATKTLRAQAKLLQTNTQLSVTIEGHCDERGTRDYNVALGLRRASIMRDYLVARGVDPYRIQIISFGREKPVATCSRERCWKLNRRAVLTIDGAGGQAGAF